MRRSGIIKYQRFELSRSTLYAIAQTSSPRTLLLFSIQFSISSPPFRRESQRIVLSDRSVKPCSLQNSGSSQRLTSCSKSPIASNDSKAHHSRQPLDQNSLPRKRPFLARTQGDAKVCRSHFLRNPTVPTPLRWSQRHSPALDAPTIAPCAAHVRHAEPPPNREPVAPTKKRRSSSR